MKHIIIGGVAGGATAAARIRRADEGGRDRPTRKRANTSRTPTAVCRIISAARSPNGKNSFYRPRLRSADDSISTCGSENEAVGIDTAAKSVEVRRADGSTYTESYDKLLPLSPGASPVRPPLKGIDSEGIFHPEKRRRYGPYQKLYNYTNGRQRCRRGRGIYRIGNGRELASRGSGSVDRRDGQSG